jgi:3-oxoacyl-[acyl-carrier protein] reductase
VVLADIDADAAREACEKMGGAFSCGIDVTREQDAERLIVMVVAEFGRVDGVVAAAGRYQGTPLDDIRATEWDAVQEVNVRGAFLTAQAALRNMRLNGSGSIVMLGSVAGQTGGLQSGAAYATSKAAVIGMTKALARNAGPHGVRVNCVNPGFIDSGMSLGITAEDRERTINATPLRRAGTAEEVADVAAWLLSDASSFVTGTHIDVNGGLLMD